MNPIDESITDQVEHSTPPLPPSIPSTTPSSVSLPKLDTLHLCCDEGEFTDSFDAPIFIAEKRKYVPLDTIHSDLSVLSQQLHQSVVTLVHDSVLPFVSVCDKLSHTEADIRKVIAPLNEVSARCVNVQQRVSSAKAQVGVLFRDLSQTEAIGRQYELVAEALNIVDRLSLLYSSGGGGTGTDVTALPRTAVDVGRAKEIRSTWTRLAQASSSSSTSSALSSEVAEYEMLMTQLRILEDAFLSDLQTRFLSAMKAFGAPGAPDSDHQADAFRNCLHCYRIMGLEDTATIIFRENVVRPCVEGVLTWKASSNARTSTTDVATLLPLVIAAVNKECSSIITISREISPLFQMLVKGVWTCVCDTVLKRLSFLFAPGVTETFQVNFRSGMMFVRKIEEMCVDEVELKALRQSSDTLMWQRKWNLDVYMTLRQNELHQATEKALSTNDTVAAIRHTVRWCYDPQVFLPPLAAKLTRLCFANMVKIQAHIRTQLTTSNQITPTSCHQLWVDLNQLSQHDIPTQHAPMIQQQLGQLFDHALISKLTSIVNVAAEEVAKTLIHLLSEQCIAALSLIRNIKSQYTMTKKAMPTAASGYVDKCLDSIATYKEKALALPCGPGRVDQWISETIQNVTLKYKTLIAELITTVRKAQESLAKFKRTGATPATTTHQPGLGNSPVSTGGRPPPDAMSDIDKIYVQLFLDVEAYGAMLRRYGVHKESYQPYGQLMGAVRRGQWLLGADIPEPPVDEEFV